MHTNSLLRRLLRMDRIVIEEVSFEGNENEEIFIIQVRPFSRDTFRCSICGKKSPGYDSSNRVRRWRSLDLGSGRVFLEATLPRVRCSEHGVVVAKVPWARHDSDYTYDFEMAVTWLTLHATMQDVAEFFRIEWHTVGSIARRVQESLEKEQPNRFDNLEQIGIDETSYKKGHKYMTVIINHETGHLIWAKKGHGKEILTKFFLELTEEQRANIKYVTADGARWIADCIREYCPNAVRCIDPFHVVAWANDTLDEVRKAAIRLAKRDLVEGNASGGSKKNTVQDMRSTCC